MFAQDRTCSTRSRKPRQQGLLSGGTRIARPRSQNGQGLPEGQQRLPKAHLEVREGVGNACVGQGGIEGRDPPQAR